jgi:urea transport system permease protein
MLGGDTTLVALLEILNSVTVLILLALGLAVIFGMMRIVNLAQGEFFTIGAFTTLAAVRFGQLPFWVGMMMAPIVTGAIGLILERFIIRYLYGRQLDAMLVTWGISLVLIGLITVIFGPATFGAALDLGHFNVGNYQYSIYRLIMSAAAIAMLAVTYVVFHVIPFGRRARATIANPEMAAALGINTSRVFMLTFAFGSALAGAAGALLAPLVSVVPTMGVLYIARAFISVIVGGPMALLGTSAAASVLGTIEALISRIPLFHIVTSGFCSPPPCIISIGGSAFFGQVALLLFAILILRLRPQGLTGAHLGR